MATTTSFFFKLDWKDFVKGLIVAAVTTPLTIILETLEAGSIVFDWKHIGIVALSSTAAYLLKNLLSDTEVKIRVDKDTAKLVKEGKLTASIVDPKSRVV